MEFIEQVRLPFSVEQLFDLVADIEHYSVFLPGWKTIRIKHKYKNFLSVEQELGLPLLHTRFTSFAELDRPGQIHITATSKSFGVVDILWDFVAHNEFDTSLMLRIRMLKHNSLQELLLSRMFESSAHVLLNHFVERAYQIYKPVHLIVNAV